jgi:hypothetical protein
VGRQRARYEPSSLTVAVAIRDHCPVASSKRSIATVRPAAPGTLPRKRASLRTIVPARVDIAICGLLAVITPSVCGGGGAADPPVPGSPAAIVGVARATTVAHSASVGAWGLGTLTFSGAYEVS